jgi:hypothetical protein
LKLSIALVTGFAIMGLTAAIEPGEHPSVPVAPAEARAALPTQ